MNPHPSTFQTHDGLTLKKFSWNCTEEPRGTVVLVHGLFEHCLRYEHVADFFVAQGLNVIAYDQRGHGSSEGLRGYVEKFSDFTRDLESVLAEIQQLSKDKPIFLVSHSFGCAVSVATLLDQPELPIRGLVTSAGAFQPGSDIHPLKIKAAGFLSAFLPKFPVEKLQSGSTSRDPEVVRKYEEDPLVYRGAVRARLGGETLKTLAHIQENANKLTLPLLLMHGTADTMTEPAGTEMLYEKSSSKDKTLKKYEGFFHELFNEPEKEEVLDDVMQWIEARL